jgi:hypothetical protein
MRSQTTSHRRDDSCVLVKYTVGVSMASLLARSQAIKAQRSSVPLGERHSTNEKLARRQRALRTQFAGEDDAAPVLAAASIGATQDAGQGASQGVTRADERRALRRRTSGGTVGVGKVPPVGEVSSPAGASQEGGEAPSALVQRVQRLQNQRAHVPLSGRATTNDAAARRTELRKEACVLRWGRYYV